MGRPSTLDRDPGLVGRIAQKVVDWNEPSVAAASEGVPERSHFRWMERGKRDDDEGVESIYSGYWHQIARAFAEAEVAAIQELRHPTEDKEGRTDRGRIQAAQFFLERARRERYGKSVEIRQRAEGEVVDVLRRVCGELDPAVRLQVLEGIRRVCGVDAADGVGEPESDFH